MPKSSIRSIIPHVGEPRDKPCATCRSIRTGASKARGEVKVDEPGGGGNPARCVTRPDCQGRHPGHRRTSPTPWNVRSGGGPMRARTYLRASGWCSPGVQSSRAQRHPPPSKHTRGVHLAWARTFVILRRCHWAVAHGCGNMGWFGSAMSEVRLGGLSMGGVGCRKRLLDPRCTTLCLLFV